MATHNQGPNLTLQQISAELHQGKLTESQAINDANKYAQTHPSSVQSAANSASSALGSALSVPGDIAGFLTNGKNWIRLLEVIAGAILIVMGLHQLTGGGGTIVNVAKKAAAVAA